METVQASGYCLQLLGQWRGQPSFPPNYSSSTPAHCKEKVQARSQTSKNRLWIRLMEDYYNESPMGVVEIGYTRTRCSYINLPRFHPCMKIPCDTRAPSCPHNTEGLARSIWSRQISLVYGPISSVLGKHITKH